MGDTRVLPFTACREYTSALMTRNSPSRILPSAVWLPLACLLVAAQVLLAFAPVIEWEFGADARPHVEAAGTSVHHAHNPSDCVACAARGLLAVANQAPEPAITSLRSAPVGLELRDEQLALLSESQARPRAPPFGQA
jgi:hypothetical protein